MPQLVDLIQQSLNLYKQTIKAKKSIKIYFIFHTLFDWYQFWRMKQKFLCRLDCYYDFVSDWYELDSLTNELVAPKYKILTKNNLRLLCTSKDTKTDSQWKLCPITPTPPSHETLIEFCSSIKNTMNVVHYLNDFFNVDRQPSDTHIFKITQPEGYKLETIACFQSRYKKIVLSKGISLNVCVSDFKDHRYLYGFVKIHSEAQIAQISQIDKEIDLSFMEFLVTHVKQQPLSVYQEFKNQDWLNHHDTKNYFHYTEYTLNEIENDFEHIYLD